MVSLKRSLFLFVVPFIIESAAVPTIGDIEGGLIIADVRNLDVGTLIVYQDGNSTTPRQLPRDPGCGTNSITCSTNHATYRPVCVSLMSVLNNNVRLPDSPRSVCLSVGGSQCCISWSQPAVVEEKNLLSSAQRVLAFCLPGDTVLSGQEKGVALGLDGTCVTQCMSNRPDGCGN